MAVATDRFMKAAEVMALMGWSPRTLHRKQHGPAKFPRPSFGEYHGRRWRRSLVEDWVRRQERLNGVA